MGAFLVFLVVVVVCVYAMSNPADLVDVSREIWTVARDYPEQTVAFIASSVLVFIVFWGVLKVMFGMLRSRHTVSTSGSQVMSATLQRRVDHEDEASLERCARHEAAHTLAAYLLRATDLTANVYVVGDRGGRASYRHTEEATPWDDAYDDLVIGFAAQVIDHQHGHFDAGSMADMASQQRRMMTIISAGKQPSRHEGPLTVEALIESTRAEAEQLLEQHPDELERITAALVEERELDDDEIRALIANQTPAIAA